MQIQVRIHEEGSLRNQRYAFTNRFTLVSELLQNARRAGATQIDVSHDAATKILVVTDNGRGIDNFQKLLSFNESGWDAATCAEENPFGVGFSKCLYAASRCIVASGQQRIDFDTSDALAQSFIEVLQAAESDAIGGTRVELHGVDLPDLDSRIMALCMGFPVPVSFNGHALERPHAAAHVASMPSPMGTVHLAGAQDGEFSHQTFVYLQGFCVLKMGYYYLCGDINVVHLDSRQFVARLPDRDKLIDEDVQYKRVEAELKHCWRQTLQGLKEMLAPAQFVERYFSAIRFWGHTDLLNTLDALPTELFEAIVGYPILDNTSSRDYLASVAVAPTRETIERSMVTLVDLGWLSDDNACHWMLARAKSYLAFDGGGLPADHWVQRYVRRLEDESVEIKALQEQARAVLDGRWISPQVVLCEAVLIQIGSESVVITNEGVFHNGTLFIPAGETSGESVRQASSFTDESKQFMESDLNADRDALADLIRRLRSVDPVQTLDSLLQELGLGNYPLLHGKSFHVSVGMGLAPGHSVELVG